ncbi:hypothetical protein ACGFNU_44355 [Spirillospora sp. NPDC048911]|uniref:hypothetical protein n=1 Tax=Spirillospora sp. NPDC048911 TaxID=3364527 RepID=UPI00371E0818
MELVEEAEHPDSQRFSQSTLSFDAADAVTKGQEPKTSDVGSVGPVRSRYWAAGSDAP